MSRQSFLLKIDKSPDIQSNLQLSLQNKFSGLLTTIVDDGYKRILLDEKVAERQQCFTRSPLIFKANDWLYSIFPMINMTNILDSSSSEVRKNYKLLLDQEFNFINHVKPRGYYYIRPTCEPETVAKFLLEKIEKTGNDLIFIVEIELHSQKNYTRMYRRDLSPIEEDIEDTWMYWNAIHKAANYHQRIEVAIVLSSDLPSNELEIYRWFGEPVIMLVIPHNTFTTNSSNFPVMTKKQQEIVKMFMQNLKLYIVIEPKSSSDHRIKSYLEYIEYLSKSLDRSSEEEKDCLKYPLQPLHDNLDFSTYEVFERDPAKYILYQRAIENALKDMISEEEKETRKAIVLLVGAGRGPLIRSTLNAATNTHKKVKIIAVEKNPNAIVTLTCLIKQLWPDKEIELIAKDMRNIVLEEKADILVSELLGSFGDNELSPECLDGVQHLLKPTGVSIPANSKSYIQPIMTKRTYGQVQKRKGENKKREMHSEHTEVNWLIYSTNIFHIDNFKEVFTFVHPNNDNPIDNSRYGKFHFESSIDCILHGFSGYFSSKLYKDIEISIVPDSHTKGMISWYSVFFPIATPIQLKKGDKIEVEFWRKCNTEKVWYEWKVNAPEETIVHNLNGEIHPIFLA
ncbi:unnamed protein product [Chironomus riparius]|uniref:Protein arginine N-methyltransferase n=1 Tax=Chironomus riparius TaxID=315576 RepID=A0A9N9WNT6_9DIPT|nr:unnamed protein product [Chironomus riparius]